MKTMLLIIMCVTGDCKYFVPNEPQFAINKECEAFRPQVQRQIESRVPHSKVTVECVNHMQLLDRELWLWYDGVQKKSQF